MSMTPPTRTRAIGAIGQQSPTRGLVADDQEIDTAVDRVFDPTKGGSGSGTRSVALWMTIAVLLIAALGGVVWSRGQAGPTKRSPQHVARAETRAAPVAQQGRAATTTRRRTTSLTITSTPRATVYIDNARVGDTPINGRTLTVGRSYQIRLEKKGYRTKRETIAVSGTKAIRRNYTLQRVGRR
jgi:hypothetical protein